MNRLCLPMLTILLACDGIPLTPAATPPLQNLAPE
jgi:hypothetical protein